MPSSEAKACFGITQDRLTPSELIQAMLRAEIDLLWFGGIGTYVKASSESHAELGGEGLLRHHPGPADAERAHPGDAARRDRPALVRRHRHLCEGVVGEPCRARRRRPASASPRTG